MTAFDVGANVGYFTLLLSNAARPAGHVFAFEPDPENLAFLQSHLALNRRKNVSVIAAAAAARTGQARFDCAKSMGRISENGKTTVRTIRLDEFPTPDLIKMDIEGGELDAIPGAVRILAEKRTIWLIALHNSEACLEPFRQLGYGLRVVSDGHVLAKPLTNGSGVN